MLMDRNYSVNSEKIVSDMMRFEVDEAEYNNNYIFLVNIEKAENIII